MSLQFGTFDTLEDRRELVIMFQKLGEKLPESLAREVRARWLQSLMQDSLTMDTPLFVNPDSCSPVGAYCLFIQIVGVLGVPIDVAAKKLERCIRET